MTNVIPVENISMTNYLDILKEALEILFSNDGTISAKDLTLCHRKKIFSIINPVPMTIETLSQMTIGKIAEYVIKRYFMLFNRFDFDLTIQYKKIKGVIDIYDRLTDTIIEIKTSKSYNITKPKKYDEEQIKNYMAMVNCGKGVLLYSANNFSNWKQFTVHLSPQEIQDRLEKTEFDSQQILKAIDSQDPSLVNGIYLDNSLNWLCRDCPYLKECQNLRFDDSKKFPQQTKNIFS